MSSVDKFVRDPNPIFYDETPDSSQQPPCNCFKCGGPFGGLHCRQCTCDQCRRKFTVEVCSLCCGKDGKLFDNCPNPTHFKDFYNSLQQPQTHSAESFNDNPNFGYTPQEPFVYNQDPSEIFSQSPPQIDQRYCYGCGDPLDDLFCQRCTCESCGNDAHCGYDCPPQVPFVYDQDMCFNQNFDNNFPQTSPSFPQQFPCCENCGGPHETFQCQPLNQNFYEPNLCYNSNSSGFDQYQPPQYTVIHQPPQETSVQARENLMKSIQTFLKKFNRISFRETPKVLLLAWEKFFEIKHAFKEKQHQPEDIQELLRKLLKDLKIISEELADYVNTPNWNCHAFYDNDDEDDDEEYTIAITPVLPTVEPDNSLSMGDEHLSTIPEKKESSVEDLVPIPSESKGISDSMCDVPFCKNSHALDALKDHSEIFFNPNDDYASSDDDPLYNKDIDYVDASPPDSELIEALKDNLTPSTDFVLKSPSSFPNSFLEETDTSDNSLPESEIFCFDMEEKSSGNPTSHSDLSLPDYEAFYCDNEPNLKIFTIDVVEDIFDNTIRELYVHVPNVFPTHPSLYLDSDFAPSDDSLGSDLVVSFPSETRNKIFDPGIFIEVQSKRFLSPNEFSISFIRDPLSPVFDTLLPFSSENEEKVFNPGSLSSNEEKSPHLLSHRGFNPSKIISDFSESPMMISGGDIPILDVLFLHFYPP
ncbi:hypothetical protein Tco_0086375 [Tanacetum coccineum]